MLEEKAKDPGPVESGSASSEADKAKAAEQAKLAAIAELKSELGIDKLELALLEKGQAIKVQPLPGKTDWVGLGKEVIALVGEGIAKFGGGGGDGGDLAQMLMMDALEWNRVSKAILMRAVARGLGQNIPEHRIVR